MPASCGPRRRFASYAVSGDAARSCRTRRLRVGVCWKRSGDGLASDAAPRGCSRGTWGCAAAAGNCGKHSFDAHKDAECRWRKGRLRLIDFEWLAAHAIRPPKAYKMSCIGACYG